MTPMLSWSYPQPPVPTSSWVSIYLKDLWTCVCVCVCVYVYIYIYIYIYICISMWECVCVCSSLLCVSSTIHVHHMLTFLFVQNSDLESKAQFRQKIKMCHHLFTLISFQTCMTLFSFFTHTHTRTHARTHARMHAHTSRLHFTASRVEHFLLFSSLHKN